MAEIVPFRGSRYDPARVALEDVVSPPYDVLAPDDVRVLRARSPYNAVHVDLPIAPGETDGDADRRAVYRRAADALRRWHEEGVLVREDEPALYLIEQAFRAPDGFERLRRGMVARLRLADVAEGVVLPHEKTHAGPKADRLELMRATGATLSQVFMLYPDDDGAATAALAAAADAAAGDTAAAAATVRDRDGVVHRVVPVHGAPAARFCAALRGQRLIIADGHHRYETALHYRDERRAAGHHDADWLMVYLCSMNDPGLTVLPTHRLLRGVDVPPMEVVLERLQPHFTVFPERGGDAESCRLLSLHLHRFADRGKVFGLYFPRETACCTVELRDPAAVAHLLDEGFSPVSAQLAVTVLHYLIFRDALGMDPTGTEGHIDYVTSATEAFARLSTGSYSLGAFLNPTLVSEVRAVAEAGETMPQKSTYFYPKLLTGLVYDLHGGD